MKIIAFLNIKGGVGKTTSTLAFALLLSQEHHKRVLVLDGDKQANSTKSLGCYGARYTTASLLTEKELVATAAVQRSSFGVDVIGASWGLMKANQDVLLDVTRPQQYRLKKQLEVIRGNYDYCLIDCPPDINMATINALAITHDVLIPIRVDKYGFDGLEYVTDAVQEMQEFNASLNLRGCFLTQYQPNTNLSVSGVELLRNELGLHGLQTPIRMTVKVGESAIFNGHTNVKNSRVINFVVQALMDGDGNVRDAALFNVLSYIWHQVVTRRENSAFFLDEMYLYLNPVVVEWLRNFCKRSRKYNAHIFMATQNLADFEDPAIRHMTKPLFELALHKFLFYPGDVDREAMRQLLSLTDSEMEVITASRQRHCLYICANEKYSLEVGTLEGEKQWFGE